LKYKIEYNHMDTWGWVRCEVFKGKYTEKTATLIVKVMNFFLKDPIHTEPFRAVLLWAQNA